MQSLYICGLIVITFGSLVASLDAASKAQYLARWDEHRALDQNGAVARAWGLLEHYWQQLVFERDQVYALSLPLWLNETQQQALVARLARQGWRAWMRESRITQASCATEHRRCRCRCTAVDGFALGASYLGMPDVSLKINGQSGDPLNIFYGEPKHELYVEPTLPEAPKDDDEEEDDPWAGFYTNRCPEQRRRRASQDTACAQLKPADLAPVQLLYLDTFADPATQ